jgi:hypothetical protein
MKELFPLVVPTSHNILAATEISATSFPMYNFSLPIPEVFNSSWILESSYALLVIIVHD